MIHEQTHQPRNAKVGDAWTDGKSFKRVLSRGGAWENVNLGSKHPDEVDHDAAEQRPEAEQQQQGAGESSDGSGELPQGDGDNGQVPGGAAGQGQQESEPVAPTSPETGGVDGNGSPVV